MSEQEEAKRDGARLQPNSGRGPIAKGDAKWHNFLVDYKEYSKSFSVSKSVWAKVCTDAFTVGLDYNPLIKVVLGDTDRVRLGIVEWAVLEELVEKAEAYDDIIRQLV